MQILGGMRYQLLSASRFLYCDSLILLLHSPGLVKYKTLYKMDPNKPKKMSGRTSDIIFRFSVITFPMLIFAGALLGLVFYYRVTHNDPPYPHLQVPGATDEPGIYYVNLSVTHFTFIASWSSTLAPMLVGFVLALASYPICRRYLAQVRSNPERELPTPYQLALTLMFMNGGGFGAMWSWFKYHWSWRKERVRQSSTLGRTAVVAVLATALASVTRST